MARSKILYTLSCILAIATTVPTAAFAADGDAPRVVGGERSNVCAWPTTVGLNGCTGTLVHPQVLIYAAHCGSNYRTGYLGESVNNPGHRISFERCETYPGGGTSGNDYAYCILSEPIEDIPIVPPLMGEDTALLKAGQMVWAVGFGENDAMQSNIKHEVELPITGFEGSGNQFIVAGKDGKDGCVGDSGGPLYIELPDGRGWRVFGITSYGPYPCGAGGGWAQMHLNMPWFEEKSGFDLTPCHDADGNPDPDERCKNFPLEPGVGGGTWEGLQCEWGAMTEEDGEEDTEAPTVTITSPKADASFEPGEDVVVVVDAEDNVAIANVKLFVEGVESGELDEGPFEWELSELDPGTYELVAQAEDEAGNVAESDPVSFTVEADDDEDDDTTEDDDDSSSTDDSSDEDDSTDDESEGDDDEDESSSSEDDSSTEEDDPSSSDDEEDDEDDDKEDGDDDESGDDEKSKDPGNKNDKSGGCAISDDSNGSALAFLALLIPAILRRRARS